MPSLITEWKEKLNDYEADIELINLEINASFDSDKIRQLKLFRLYLSGLKRTVDNLDKLY